MDLTEEPFSITEPHINNDDTSAPDYYEALQLASDKMAENPGLMDTMGGDGGRGWVPPFTVSTSKPIIMRDGVAFQGANKAASRIIQRMDFPQKSMFDFGDKTNLPRHASFGGQLKDLHLSSRMGITAAPGNFVVDCDNVQDSGYILDNCQIDGGSHFGAVKYVNGIGGASIVKMRDLVVIARQNAQLIGNVPMAISVSGATMVTLEEIEPSCGWLTDSNPALGAIPNSYGICCYAGDIWIKGVHGEKVQTPVWFGDGGPFTENMQAKVERITGGGGNTCLVRVENSSKWLGKIALEYIMPKSPGIPLSLWSSQPGVPSIAGEIRDRIRV